MPLGTGNGVATSLGLTLESCIQSLLKGTTKHVDLFDVSRTGDVPRVGVLQLALGAIADHDILTEKRWRWMGALRLTLAPLWVLLLNRPVFAELEIRPDLEVPGCMKKEGRFFMVQLCNMPWLASDCL